MDQIRSRSILATCSPVTVAFADGTTTEIKDNRPMIRLMGAPEVHRLAKPRNAPLNIELQDVVEAAERAAQFDAPRQFVWRVSNPPYELTSPRARCFS